MPRILIYGEDGLTLKYTKERLGEILEQLEDNSNPADCTVFFRPSFGRGQYGEFDAIIIAQEKAYLIEAKWDENGKLKRIGGLRKDQLRRHEIFEWYRQYWKGEKGEAWDMFAEMNNTEFKKRFPCKNKNGENVPKFIPKSNDTLGMNLQTVLGNIGTRNLVNVLLIFYKDNPPKVGQANFTPVFVKYDPTIGLFSELE